MTSHSSRFNYNITFVLLGSRVHPIWESVECERLHFTNRSAATNWIGHDLTKTSSADAALTLAVQAFRHTTQQVAPSLKPTVGLSCVVEEEPAANDKNIGVVHIAAQNDRQTILASIDHAFTDSEDGWNQLWQLCQKTVQSVIETTAENVGDPTELFDQSATIVIQQAAQIQSKLWANDSSLAWSLPNGDWMRNIHSQPAGLLCGSFDPLHGAHTRLRDISQELIGDEVFYELCIQNADKPPLDFITIESRRQQFRHHPLAVSQASTFVKKSELLPDTIFIVGADTAERILDCRFYENSVRQRNAAFSTIDGNQCQFLVAARLHREQLLTLDQLDVPAEHAHLFAQIPADTFRMDVSSSELRLR